MQEISVDKLDEILKNNDEGLFVVMHREDNKIKLGFYCNLPQILPLLQKCRVEDKDIIK